MIKAKFQNLQDLNSRIFKYFQAPYLFSSTFNGLEVFIPNSNIFKDFSSTLWTLDCLHELMLLALSLHDNNAALQTCVEYADMASDVSADMLRDPITYALLCFLRLRRRRHFACADCPHRLIRHHNTLPVWHLLYVSCNPQWHHISSLPRPLRCLQLNYYTTTHVCPGLPGWAGTRKVKTNLDFTEARDSEWQWHQLGHMQVCTSLQIDNYASTPPLSCLQAGCPSCNSVKALKAKLPTVESRR